MKDSEAPVYGPPAPPPLDLQLATYQFDPQATTDEVVNIQPKRMPSQNIDKWVEHCGQWRVAPDPATLREIHFKWLCRYWRKCARCFGIRRELLKKRIARAHEQQPIYVSIIAQQDWVPIYEAHIHKQGKNYLKLPIGNQQSYLFTTFPVHENAPTWELEALMSLEWDVLANTPAGMRFSGDMGRLERTAVTTDADGTIEVPTLSGTREVNGEQVPVAYPELQAIFDQAAYAVISAHGVPTTVHAVQEAIYTWYDYLQIIAKARDIRLTNISRKCRVRLTSFNWQITKEAIRAQLTSLDFMLLVFGAQQPVLDAQTVIN